MEKDKKLMNEKELKREELSDEELDNVAGGINTEQIMVDTILKMLKLINANIRESEDYAHKE